MGYLKSIIKRIPLLSWLAKLIYFKVFALFRRFPGSKEYWEARYASGGNSGGGSYNQLAKFKARVLNDFSRENEISTVIEYGCGDGSQLELADYKSYIGFDVSEKAVSICRANFKNDDSKRFGYQKDYAGECAELTLSLDVIYHLVEDQVYEQYMQQLFSSSLKYVAIYSSNTSEQANLQAGHVKHRKFSDWIEKQADDWVLKKHIPNDYPYNGDDESGSFADFYIYERRS